MRRVSKPLTERSKHFVLTSLVFVAFISIALHAQTQIGPFDVLPRSIVPVNFGNMLLVRAAAVDLDLDGRADIVLPAARAEGHGFMGLRLDVDDVWKQIPLDLSSKPNDVSRAADAFNVAVGDIDGDGWPDVIVPQWDPRIAGYRFPTLCFRNDRRGGFTYDPNSGLQDLPRADQRGAHLFDADGDGDLDLYLFGSQRNPDLLLLNDGTGRFTDVTATHLPLEPTGLWTMWVDSADLDGDGRKDLFIARTGSEALVFRNQGNGVFAIGQQFHLIRNGTHVSLGDLDGDGFPDAFVGTGSGEGDWLLRNDGAGNLVDHRQGMAVRALETITLSSAFADLDGDGRPEIVIAGHHWPTYPNGAPYSPIVWRNEGGMQFRQVTHEVHRNPEHRQIMSTVQVADFDGDGDLDLFLFRQVPLFAHGGLITFNLRRHLDAPREAPVGTTLPLHLHGHSGDVLFPFLSASTSPSSLPAWIPIPGIDGRLGVDPSAIVMLPPRVIPTQTGPVTLSIPLPPDPALRALRIWSQALHVDTAAPEPRVPHLTNRVHVRIP